MVEKTGRGRDSTLTTMSREYDEQGPQWPPVKGGLLKRPVFIGLIKRLIREMNYF